MMRRPVEFTFTEGYDPSPYKQAGNSQLYNFYVSKQQDRAALFPTPGYSEYSTHSFGNNPRGVFESKLAGGLLIAYDTNVYLWQDGQPSPELINTGTPLTTTVGKIFFAENYVSGGAAIPGQVAISDGLYLYIYTPSTGSFLIADTPAGVLCGMVDYLDSFFILQDIGTNNVYFSASNNGLYWLNTVGVNVFVTPNSTTIGLAVLNRQIVILGDVVGNIYYETGNINYPFLRDNNTPLSYGCLSRDSISVGFGVLAWLGISRNNQPIVLMMEGGQAKSLSSENVTTQIGQLTDPSNSNGFIYQMNGHIFYQLNFWDTSDQLSLLFDITMGTCTRICELNYAMSQVRYLSAWDNGYYCLLNNISYLYEFAWNIYTNNGALIPRTWISKNINFRNKKFSVPKFMVYLSQGMEDRTATTSQGTLSVSHDLGVTFPITQRKNMAALGSRIELYNFYKLGTNYWWTFKLEFLTDAQVVLMGAGFDMIIEQGN